MAAATLRCDPFNEVCTQSQRTALNVPKSPAVYHAVYAGWAQSQLNDRSTKISPGFRGGPEALIAMADICTYSAI
eukprot:2136087-Pyramimonas_sp.AAC.3